MNNFNMAMQYNYMHGFTRLQQIALALLVGLGIALPGTAAAQAILQPASATTNMGTAGSSDIDNVRDQSGLSPGYTSGNDFDTYIATNPTINMSGLLFLSNAWQSTSVTGNVDFNLGGTFTIAKMALWNFGGNNTANVIGFNLLADDNAAFTSPTNLGSFTANPNTGPSLAVLPQVFTFSPTNASFVRMQITSNNGFANGTVLGEVAFGTGMLSSSADLSIAKVGDVDPVMAGNTLVYTVTVENDGPDTAENVVVTDTLPSGVTGASTSGCSEDPNGVPTCTLGNIASEGSAQYTIKVTVVPEASGTITNEAMVTSDADDPDTSNNTVTEDTTVTVVAVDADGDGIPDNTDQCDTTAPVPPSTVMLSDGSNCRVADQLLTNSPGCSIEDLIEGCAENPGNHGQFVDCVDTLTNTLVEDGDIAGREKGRLIRCVAQSKIP